MVSYVCRVLERLGVCPRDPVGAFWERDTAFMKLYASIRDHTVVSVDRCYKLYQMAKFTNHIPGAIAGLGIYKGGIAKMILQVTPSEKKYFLFDTFSGIPKDHANEKERESIRHISDFSDVTLEDVQRYLASDRCVFKQGMFPDTAHGLEDERFSLVYLDADLYQSTKDGLAFFYPRLNNGGILVIDDYGSRAWEGVTRAVNEFVDAHDITPIHSTRSQCVIMKCRTN